MAAIRDESRLIADMANCRELRWESRNSKVDLSIGPDEAAQGVGSSSGFDRPELTSRVMCDRILKRESSRR